MRNSVPVLALLVLCLIAQPAQAFLGVLESRRIGANKGGLGPLVSNARIGVSTIRVSDLNGDGHDDIVVSGGEDPPQFSQKLRVLMLDENLMVIGETILEAGVNGVPPQADVGLGWSLVGLGDLDGDGTDDIAAATPYDNQFWIFFLNTNGTVKAAQPVGSGNTPGLPASGAFSWSMASLGDRDGDGKPELVVSSNTALWFVELNADGTAAVLGSIPSSEVPLGGYQEFNSFADDVTPIGDLDGNGSIDLAVGSVVYSPSDWNPSIAVLFLDSADSVIATSFNDMDSPVYSGPVGNWFGSRLAWLEDTACGSPALALDVGFEFGTSAVGLMHLDAAGVASDYHFIGYNGTELGDLSLVYPVSNARFGRVDSLGDLDGNGVDDLAVGAPNYNSGQGEFWLLKMAPQRVDARSMRFDYVFLGDHQDSTVTLYNDGCETVVGTLSTNSAQFQVLGGGGAFSVDPGDSLVVGLRFEPLEGNGHTGRLMTGSAFGDVPLYGVGRVATTNCYGHWNIDTFNAANLGPGPDNHALWCGVQAGEPGYLTAPGFGTDWDEPIMFAAPVDPLAEVTPVRIRFDYNLDSENGVFFLIERMTYGLWTEVFWTDESTRDANGVFSTPAELDLSFDVPQLDRVMIDGVPGVAMRLRVLTLLYSDESGFDSDGAIQIDNLQVWVDDMLVSDADFEPGGSDGGWCTEPTFVIPEPPGSWQPGFGMPPGENGMNTSVNAMLVSNDQLIAAGRFTQAGVAQANRIAAFDGSGWHALGNGFTDGPVYCLAEVDGLLYAGGGFTTAGGSPADWLAVWDGNSWQPTGAPVTKPIHALGAWDDKLYVPRESTGAEPEGVAVFDGQEWAVQEMYSSPGNFAEFQGALHLTASSAAGPTLYRIDATGLTELSLLPMSGGDSVYDSVVYGSVLVIAGSNGLHGWDGTQWIDSLPHWSPTALTVYDSKLIGMGDYPHVMEWDGVNVQPLTPPMSSGFSAHAAEVYDGSLWAGGDFYRIGDLSTRHIARWNPPDAVGAPEDVPPAMVGTVTLSPGRPNPFNPSVTFQFSIPAAGHVAARVFDLRGRRIATLADDDFTAGTHPLQWHGRDDGGSVVASGAYIVRVEHEAGSTTRRVVLLK